MPIPSHYEQTGAIPDQPAWADDLIAAGLDGISQAQTVALLRGMREEASLGAFDGVDRVLAHAPIEHLADKSLISLVRGSYAFRSKVPSWSAFRDRVKTEFERRGRDADSFMHGLFDRP